MSVIYHHGKAIDDAKKDLVRDVHRLARLGVRCEGSLNGGVVAIITLSHL